MQSLFASFGRLLERPWASVLTIAVLGFALALPLLFWLALDNVRGLGGRIEDANTISVFLKVDVAADAATALAERLRQRPEIAAVDVRTPEEGLRELRERSGFAQALQVLDFNPLPTVLIVHPLADRADALVTDLGHDPAVDLVRYDAQWRRRLAAILALAQRGAQVLAGLLALAALLVIGNTVRVDIAGRAEEIAVMQLLGADAGFVRRPFLYSGLWYGTLAGVLSLSLIGIVHISLAGPLSRLANAYDHAFATHGLSLAQMLLVLATAALLGWLGAYLAASRHIAQGMPR
jgi:cell division transport system permease protein